MLMQTNKRVDYDSSVYEKFCRGLQAKNKNVKINGFIVKSVKCEPN